MKAITDQTVHDTECPTCLGEGVVCEDHPTRPWGAMFGPEPLVLRDLAGPLGECWCGAAGMPCPNITTAPTA